MTLSDLPVINLLQAFSNVIFRMQLCSGYHYSMVM